LVISSSNFIFVIQNISASPQPVNEDEKPPVSGSGFTSFNQTWYVDDGETLYYGNQTIELTGDLIINSTGRLILFNVTLEFNCSTHNEFGIDVQNGGVFNLTDTAITGLNSTTWSFKVYGNMSMENANISYMYGKKDIVSSEILGGLEIYSENVTVNNSYFHDNMNGISIILNSNESVLITNNTMESALPDVANVTIGRGISTKGYSRPVILTNNISGQVAGIDILERSEPEIRNNNLSGNIDYGIYANSVGKSILIMNNTIGNISSWDTIRFDYNWPLSDGPGAVIENNTLFDSPAGIYYSSNGYSVIKNNHIYNNSIGLYIDYSTTLIYDNIIENNSEAGLKVESWNNPNPKIELNKIKYNNNGQKSSGGYGILVDSSAGRITRNIIEHNGPNTQGSGSFLGGGIFVSSLWTASITRIDNNTIKHNSNNGIDINIQSTPLIQDNHILNSSEAGIFVKQTSFPVIGNTILLNRFGLQLDNFDDQIVGNTIDQNTDLGILLESGSNPLVSGNSISHNGDGGPEDSAIFLNGSSAACNAVLRSNDISNNSGYGILVLSSTPTIEGNEINFNDNGIHFDSSSGTVSGNGFRNNVGSGIIMEGSQANPAVDNNVFAFNTLGMDIFMGSQPAIQNNWYKFNDEGIKISGGADPTIDTNYFNSNLIGLSITSSHVGLNRGMFNSNSNKAIEIINSNFTIDNCSITNTGFADISLDDNSHVITLNTSYTKTRVEFKDALSELTTVWYLHFSGVDASDNPMANGLLKIKNMSGGSIYERRLPLSGKYDYLKLVEQKGFLGGKITSTPHKVSLELTNYAPHEQEITMDSSKSLKFTLSPNFTPSMVSNIKPSVTHTNLPLINWTPATDPDGDDITYYINISISPDADVDDDRYLCSGPFFQVTEPLSFGSGNMTYHLTIFAFDSKGSYSVTKSIMYAVNSQPRAPGITLFPLKPNKITGITCIITKPSFDADNDNITYNYRWYLNGEIQNLLSDFDTTNLTSYVPPEFTEDDQVWKCTVQAFDGYLLSPASESSEVIIKNYGPELNDTPFGIDIDEDQPAENAFNLQHVFLDDNHEPLTYEWNASKYVTVVENNSWISFVPAKDWFGKAKFRFSARDYFEEVYFDFLVTVHSVNDLPVLDPIGNITISEGEWFNFTIQGHDYADNDVLVFDTNITETFSGKVFVNENYQFSRNTGELKFKPDDSMVGKYLIMFSVEDFSKEKVVEIVNFTIQNKNDKPDVIILSPTSDLTIKEGDSVSLDGTGSSDEDEILGDYFLKVEWSLDDGTVISGKLTDEYIFEKPGTYQLTLSITDSEGETGSSTVTITVEKKDSKDEDTGGFSEFIRSPAAIAGFSIVAVVILMVVIIFMASYLRTRREKRRLVEAGLLTEEDLKKAAAQSEDLPEGEAVMIPQSSEQALQEGDEPAFHEPEHLPEPGEVDIEASEEEMVNGDTEGKEDSDDKERDSEDDSKEDSEPKGPVFGHAISFDSKESETDGLSFKKPDAEEDTTDSGKDKSNICPNCGDVGQEDPFDKNSIFCPNCGPVSKQ
jgi:parallel beta-helix repeat protein